VTAVAVVTPTPADPINGARSALGVALALGIVALLVRFVMPWFAPRPTG
jgi:hypothetical protein